MSEVKMMESKFKWIISLSGPVLSLVTFVGTFYIDPLNFGQLQPMSAIPAFLLAIIILIISQQLSTHYELSRSTLYSDRIYEAVKSYLHVITMGSPENAMKYINDNLPHLREVKNTSFNLPGADEEERANEKLYKTGVYESTLKNIAKFSKKGLLWKDIGDNIALTRFRKTAHLSTPASSELNNNYQYKLIAHNEPQINFILLEFKGGEKEVLFNWDFRGVGKDPTVLLSKDPEIVEMFSIQFSHLWSRSVKDHDSSTIRSVSMK